MVKRSIQCPDRFSFRVLLGALQRQGRPARRATTSLWPFSPLAAADVFHLDDDAAVELAANNLSQAASREAASNHVSARGEAADHAVGGVNIIHLNQNDKYGIDH